MSKRPAESSEDHPAAGQALKSGGRPGGVNDEEQLDFEDEFEDEYESEDEVFEAGVDGRPDAEREAEQQGAMDIDQDTFIPGRNKLSAGESLAPDLSTYHMLHTLEAPWPCLSLDIVRDQLGDNRTSYPATVYAVAGTQAASGRGKENQLLVTKLSGLSRMDRNQEGSDSSDGESDGEEDDEPILETKSIPLDSTTNRLRAYTCPQASTSSPPGTLVASMLESGQVVIHDVTRHISSFDNPGTVIPPSATKAAYTISAHKGVEGYALDWSPHQVHASGVVLTGDVSGKVFLTTRTESGSFTTTDQPFISANSTVEELQWSPSERSVFAAAGTDGHVKIFDTRSKAKKPSLSVQVSNTDVNVMSWSRQTAHLLASGHDDGEWAVWDLRQWKPGSGGGGGAQGAKSAAVASFNFHKEQITCLEWHPTDDSIMLAAAGDNTLTLWDLAVELDDEESQDTAGVRDVPPQLLFVHYMEQVKEGHWHPQMPGAVMATGGSGFGVFKTISV